jgi:anaerobic magnesium-protoporphyrin IX monomethyl ester cyclase
LYVQTFGALPDDEAWERAHQHYTSVFKDEDYSDIQEARPLSLSYLDATGESAGENSQDVIHRR